MFTGLGILSLFGALLWGGYLYHRVSKLNRKISSTGAERRGR